jgi:hypothetical protein
MIKYLKEVDRFPRPQTDQTVFRSLEHDGFFIGEKQD